MREEYYQKPKRESHVSLREFLALFATILVLVAILLYRSQRPNTFSPSSTRVPSNQMESSGLVDPNEGFISREFDEPVTQEDFPTALPK